MAYIDNNLINNKKTKCKLDLNNKLMIQRHRWNGKKKICSCGETQRVNIYAWFCVKKLNEILKPQKHKCIHLNELENFRDFILNAINKSNLQDYEKKYYIEKIETYFIECFEEEE